MTASSIEFFPCRVQLMGLPRSTASSTSANTSSRLENSNDIISWQPPLAKIKGVSRNLFGATDPVEMKRLYQQEAERLRTYVLERYNFDTKTSKLTNGKEEHQLTDTFKIIDTLRKPTEFPTLVEQELKQHQQQLQNKEESLNQVSSETMTPNAKIVNHANSRSKVARRYCEYSNVADRLSPAVERLKPYARQSLLTESFNIRSKNKTCLSGNGKQYTAETIALESSLDSHRNIDVLKLPQAIQAQQKSYNITGEDNDFSTSNDSRNRALEVIDSNCSCIDNCTALSLQLVVASQNIS